MSTNRQTNDYCYYLSFDEDVDDDDSTHTATDANTASPATNLHENGCAVGRELRLNADILNTIEDHMSSRTQSSSSSH